MQPRASCSGTYHGGAAREAALSDKERRELVKLCEDILSNQNVHQNHRTKGSGQLTLHEGGTTDKKTTCILAMNSPEKQGLEKRLKSLLENPNRVSKEHLIERKATILESLRSFLRRTFLLYEPLPVQSYAGSNGANVTDGLLPQTVEECRGKVQNVTFPHDFFFGAATASYQIEGGLDNTNWKQWEDLQFRPGDGQPTIEHHQQAGRACDAWNRFDADLKHLQRIGARMYRFSIDWSRIEPRPGQFDEDSLDRYVSWCQKLRAHCIEPMITLHHFAEPIWFVELGGWENRENVEGHFRRFVTHTTNRLAPYCRYWTTINELNGYAICGWLAGVHPPGKVNCLFAMLNVIRNLLIAHTCASKAIRAASSTLPTTPVVCCAFNHVLFLPSWHRQESEGSTSTILGLVNGLLSQLVSLFLNYVYNFVFLDAMFSSGRLPWFPFPFQGAALLAGWREDVQNLKDTADWIGINHYYRSYVQFTRRDQAASPQQASPTDMFVQLPFGIQLRAAAVPGFEKNEMGWDLTPSSMVRLVQILAERYPKVPIIITESGTADATDTKRVRYMAALLSNFHYLMKSSSVDLRGYLVWTLMDNFEWAEGFRPKFGLFETNFETLDRTERDLSCDLLRSIFS